MTDLCWQTAFIYLSVCLSIYVSIHSSIHLAIYIYIYIYICVCVQKKYYSISTPYQAHSTQCSCNFASNAEPHVSVNYNLDIKTQKC